MLLVKTALRTSEIEGIGLFADEQISAGTLIWVIDYRFDQQITHAQWASLPSVAQAYITKYAFVSKVSGHHVLVGDHARYVNHSDSPNVLVTNAEGDAIARIDIPAGKEITLNYLDISPSPLEFVPV